MVSQTASEDNIKVVVDPFSSGPFILFLKSTVSVFHESPAERKTK